MRSRLLLVFCAVLAATACAPADKQNAVSRNNSQSSANVETATSNDIDACTLVTKEDAERVLGLPVKDAEKVKSSITKLDNVCAFESRSEESSAGVIVEAMPDSEQAFEVSKQYQESYLQNRKVQPISGTGEQAYLVSGSKEGVVEMKIINVLKNKNWISIKVIEENPKKETTDTLEKLAKKVSDKF